jgi:hypothetical protein
MTMKLFLRRLHRGQWRHNSSFDVTNQADPLRIDLAFSSFPSRSPQRASVSFVDDALACVDFLKLVGGRGSKAAFSCDFSFGAWNLFGAWNVELGIFRFRPCRLTPVNQPRERRARLQGTIRCADRHAAQGAMSQPRVD